MKPTPPGGVLLLDEEAAAELLGSEHRLRIGESLGFLTAVDTPLGPCWREDELLALRKAWEAVPAIGGRLRPGQAAYVLGVTVSTLRESAWGKTLTRDEQGRYDSDEILAVKADRDARRRDAENAPAAQAAGRGGSAAAAGSGADACP